MTEGQECWETSYLGFQLFLMFIYNVTKSKSLLQNLHKILLQNKIFNFIKNFFIFIKIILIGARELFLKFFFWNHPQVTPGPSRSLMILIMQFLN